MDDTGVYSVAQYVLLSLHVTRFFFVAGLTEGPGSLRSLVSTTSKCLPYVADGMSIWRQRHRLVSWRSQEMSAYTSHPQYVSRPILAEA